MHLYYMVLCAKLKYQKQKKSLYDRLELLWITEFRVIVVYFTQISFTKIVILSVFILIFVFNLRLLKDLQVIQMHAYTTPESQSSMKGWY